MEIIAFVMMWKTHLLVVVEGTAVGEDAVGNRTVRVNSVYYGGRNVTGTTDSGALK